MFIGSLLIWPLVFSKDVESLRNIWQDQRKKTEIILPEVICFLKASSVLVKLLFSEIVIE